MSNIVKLKKSAVPGKVPLASDLQYGELAINYADGKLYYKAPNDTVQYISTGGGGTTGASITIGDTAPSSAEPGNLWLDIKSGILKAFYYDNSSYQWIAVSTGIALPDANRDEELNFPTDPSLNDSFSQNGKTWKWDGTSWVPDNLVTINMLASETTEYIDNTSIVYAIALG